MPCGFTCLGTFALQRETSNTDEHEKPARRLRNSVPARIRIRNHSGVVSVRSRL